MNAMSWEEIDKDWNGLQKRHRMEVAEAVARYCIGHSMKEVAKRLGQSMMWIQQRLDMVGVSAGVGDTGPCTPRLVGKGRGVQEDCARVAKEFAPSIAIHLKDDGKGKQSIDKVTGDDALGFQPYLDHYIQQGHEPAAAIRLAKAEWAAEEAIEAGVIQESKNKRDEKVNQILFPKEKESTFVLDLKMHMARVESAARFLDEAKINHLRSKATCERVASAHEKWLEQVERVLNLNPTLK